MTVSDSVNGPCPQPQFLAHHIHFWSSSTPTKPQSAAGFSADILWVVASRPQSPQPPPCAQKLNHRSVQTWSRQPHTGTHSQPRLFVPNTPARLHTHGCIPLQVTNKTKKTRKKKRKGSVSVMGVSLSPEPEPATSISPPASPLGYDMNWWAASDHNSGSPSFGGGFDDSNDEDDDDGSWGDGDSDKDSDKDSDRCAAAPALWHVWSRALGLWVANDVPGDDPRVSLGGGGGVQAPFNTSAPLGGGGGRGSPPGGGDQHQGLVPPPPPFYISTTGGGPPLLPWTPPPPPQNMKPHFLPGLLLIKNHLEERLLDQASRIPPFWGGSRSIPPDMVSDV